MLADKYVASFYHLLADNDYAALEGILCGASTISTRRGDRENDEAAQRSPLPRGLHPLQQPQRGERWEKSSRIIQALGLKRGDVVADIGCGPGYYTFKFADSSATRGRSSPSTTTTGTSSMSPD